MPDFSRYGDLLVEGDHTWEIGRQTGNTGMEEVVVAVHCVCGEANDCIHDVVAHAMSVNCSKCESNILVPDEVRVAMVSKLRELRDRNAEIRAAAGGSRQAIPDC